MRRWPIILRFRSPTGRSRRRARCGASSLRPTRDIAAAIGEIKGPRLLVGFALETDHGLEHAEDKLERKNMDMIVLNSLDDPGAGFGVDTNRVTILHRDGGGTLSGSRTSERSLRISRTRSRRSGKRRNNRKFVTFALQFGLFRRGRVRLIHTGYAVSFDGRELCAD